MQRFTVGAAVLAGAWVLISMRLQGDHIFTSGPVATRHRMFGADCFQCHEAWKGVPDDKCLKCHDAPAHHGNQTMTPSCASCHVEHKGQLQLARMTDQHCTRCHSQLQTTGEPTRFARSIQSFERGHPEFAAVRPGARDKTVLRYNHQKHMKRGLQGKSGPVNLECAGCHAPDPAGRYMQAVTFEQHCKDCHPLQLGLTLPGGVAPHAPTDVVRLAVRAQLETLAREHPERMQAEPKEEGGRRRRRGASESQPPTPVNTAQWLSSQAESIEKALVGKTCKLCHDFAAPTASAADSLPQVIAPAMPARWMKSSVYSHRAHRTLTCAVCHASAAASAETSQVLLPSAVTCLICHSPSGGSRHECTECHLHHDKSREREIDGPMEINPVMIRPRAAR